MANKTSKQGKKSVDDKAAKPLLGKPILYIGATRGVLTTCPICRTEKGWGIVSEYKGTFYCGESCVKKAAARE